jgi:hypothetical protein
MKLWITIGILALATMALPSVATAQDNSNNKDTFSHTLRGCLKQGPNANAYALTDENGKLWDLRSKNVKLGDHVNQMVTVKGKLPKNSTGNGNDTTDNPDRDNRFIVTSLKMNNESCTQP